MGLKIAVSGKGGVGKTTLVACLARLFAEDGNEVIAIDADPATNLAVALGVSSATEITPISEMRALIRERTGATSEDFGAFFKLNPTVYDLPEKLLIEHKGVKLMVLGAIRKGGSGCACPENVFLKTLLTHIILQRDEVAIVDMEAGVEHLGRATVRAVNALIVVVEPSMQSVQTALHIKKLAADIGLSSVMAVGNKLSSPAHRLFIEKNLAGISILGYMSFNEKIQEAALKGQSPLESNELLIKEAREIITRLKEKLAQPVQK